VALRFAVSGDELWDALYREGRPVQYAYLAHELPLWAVQTVYAARPWAFEMPSAGRPLSWQTLLALRRKGVRWASLTHAAGLSSTGDPAIDAALPLPERYEIPAATARAVAETQARGGRVVAVGTTVVRALEGAAAAARDGVLRPGGGETDLIITPAFRPRVVDGILSGAHAASESHFRLLAAFAGRALLAAAAAHAERAGFLTHELGDSMLVLPGALAAARAARARVIRN
jgi:S-adenosylmethionine:tRNA ribosyltransferase-isomerase